MRVAVIGATGVLGRSVVPALVAAGHDVVALARSPQKVEQLADQGAEPYRSGLLDHAGLVAMFDGADAVCNLAGRFPTGLAATRRRGWRVHDQLRTEGVRRVVDAAREAHVRRFVQDSVSFLYADHADAWIDEDSPVDITGATEPASVGESYVQDYACGSRTTVVLRFGTIVGGAVPGRTRLGRPLAHPAGLGSPTGWAHVVHPDDLGGAVASALTAPSGVYNVGAAPVLRRELEAGLHADLASGGGPGRLAPVGRRWAGARLEPFGRSLRVSSRRFTEQTGWTATRAQFDVSWFDRRTPVRP